MLLVLLTHCISSQHVFANPIADVTECADSAVAAMLTNDPIDAFQKGLCKIKFKGCQDNIRLVLTTYESSKDNKYAIIYSKPGDKFANCSAPEYGQEGEWRTVQCKNGTSAWITYAYKPITPRLTSGEFQFSGYCHNPINDNYPQKIITFIGNNKNFTRTCPDKTVGLYSSLPTKYSDRSSAVRVIRAQRDWYTCAPCDENALTCENEYDQKTCKSGYTLQGVSENINGRNVTVNRCVDDRPPNGPTQSNDFFNIDCSAYPFAPKEGRICSVTSKGFDNEEIIIKLINTAELDSSEEILQFQNSSNDPISLDYSSSNGNNFNFLMQYAYNSNGPKNPEKSGKIASGYNTIEISKKNTPNSTLTYIQTTGYLAPSIYALNNNSEISSSNLRIATFTANYFSNMELVIDGTTITDKSLFNLEPSSKNPRRAEYKLSLTKDGITQFFGKKNISYQLTLLNPGAPPPSSSSNIATGTFSVTCADGQGYDKTSAQCAPCPIVPASTYCHVPDGGGPVVIEDCPNNAELCNADGSVNSCPAEQGIKDDLCQLCNSGDDTTYCLPESGGGAAVVTDCSASETCNTDGTAKSCEPGLGIKAGSCTSCAENEMISPLNNSCESCAGGYICDGTETTTICHAQTYCPPGNGSAIICPRGSYCPEGSSSPQDCTPGMFCPEGSATPQDCPGEACDRNGITRCPDNQIISADYARCEVCPSGKTCDGTTNTCPIGARCEGEIVVDCPIDEKIASDSLACTVCPGGQVCNGTANTLGCPAGSFCPPGTGPAVVCPRGRICPTGSSEPILCKGSEYCPEGSDTPQSCPPLATCNNEKVISCQNTKISDDEQSCIPFNPEIIEIRELLTSGVLTNTADIGEPVLEVRTSESTSLIQSINIGGNEISNFFIIKPKNDGIYELILSSDGKSILNDTQANTLVASITAANGVTLSSTPELVQIIINSQEVTNQICNGVDISCEVDIVPEDYTDGKGSCSSPQRIAYATFLVESREQLAKISEKAPNIFPPEKLGQGYFVAKIENYSKKCDINALANDGEFIKYVQQILRPMAERDMTQLQFSDGDGSYIAGYTGTLKTHTRLQLQQQADTARLALQGSLSAFMNHGSCLISWKDKWGAKASLAAGGNWNESGDTETRTLRGGFEFDTSYDRYCISVDTDGSNELSKRESGVNSNEVDVTQLKGTAAFKIGLLHGESAKQTAVFTKWYTVYSYISYGQGNSITKDHPSNSYLTRVEANAWQVAGGAGLQARGKICGVYDLNAGYYTGKSEAEADALGFPTVPSSGSTNGGTFSFSMDCPLEKLPIYWNAKVRHDTDDDESTTNYGIGIGYNITDNMRFEVDWERTHVDSVINKTINANFIYDFFKR